MNLTEKEEAYIRSRFDFLDLTVSQDAKEYVKRVEWAYDRMKLGHVPNVVISLKHYNSRIEMLREKHGNENKIK